MIGNDEFDDIQFELPFRAKLTAVSGSAYSWTEQIIKPSDGSLQDANPARSGTAAVEINGLAAPVGTYVWMWFRGIHDGKPLYDFESPPSSLTVQEQDGSPSYAGVTTIQFDQADGFVVTQPVAGQARIDQTPAGASTVGYVTTGTQTLAGDKTITGTTTFTGGQINLHNGVASNGGILWLAASFLGDNSVSISSVRAADAVQVSAVLGSQRLALVTLDPGLVLGATGYARSYFSIYDENHAFFDGAWGTSGGGDTVKGGIITALGSGGGAGTLTIGTTAISGSTSFGVLYADGSGVLQNVAPTAPGQLMISGSLAWVTMSGDATINSSGALALASSGVTAGTYGDGTHVAQITVDAKGRVTAASSVAITGYSDEQAQDAVAAAIAAGTQAGLTVTYNDPGNSLSFSVTYGTSAGTACQGNDSRLSDSRTPTAHHATHEQGGSDAITSVTLSQTGLAVRGATSTALTIKPNETLTSARTLNIVTGDASRTLTFTADASIGGTNTGDQDLSGYLQAASNLSDLASASTARSNLGLGTSATHAVGDFAQTVNNLSDLASATTARTNLGLGTSATHAAGDFAQTANNLSDLANAGTARTNLGLGNVENTALSTWAGSTNVTTIGALTVTDNVSAGITDALVVGHNCNVTVGDGFGTGVLFRGQSNGGTNRSMGEVAGVWATASDSTRKGRLSLRVSDSSSTSEGLRVEALSGGAGVGFLGQTAALRQTGDAGTALVTFGLMSGTPTFAAANLTGTTLPSGIVTSSLTALGTVTVGTWSATAIAETKGGTNQTTYTLGDVLYASAANTLSKLAGNTTATKKFLRQTGTGSVSAAPAWDVIVAGDYPTFVAAGASHAVGAVPDPGSTAHTNFPYLLGDNAAWRAPSGVFAGTPSVVATSESTTSATPVELTTTQRITFTLDETRTVLIFASANATAASVVSPTLTVDVDGTGHTVGQGTIAGVNFIVQLVGCFTISLAAGSHTLKLEFSTQASVSTSFSNRSMYAVLT